MILKLLYKISIPVIFFGAGYMAGSGNCQRYNVKVNEEKIVDDITKEISPYIEIKRRNNMDMNDENNRKNTPEKDNENKNVFKTIPWKTLDEFF